MVLRKLLVLLGVSLFSLGAVLFSQQSSLLASISHFDLYSLPPVANAGRDETVLFRFAQGGNPYMLDGTQSESNVDVHITNYSWLQIEGPIVKNDYCAIYNPPWSFDAKYCPIPLVTATVQLTTPGVYKFTLVVTDSVGQISEPDEVVITVTTSSVTYLPAIYRMAKSANCMSTRLLDFSKIEQDLPNDSASEYTYENGAYKISPIGKASMRANSPDWGMPQDFEVSVETWSSKNSNPPAFGLMYGWHPIDDYYNWDYLWGFTINPESQTYILSLYLAREAPRDFLRGSSSAIDPDPSAHQILKVRHEGKTSKLFINGVQVATYEDMQFAKYNTSVGMMVINANKANKFAYFDNLTASGINDCIVDYIQLSPQ